MSKLSTVRLMTPRGRLRHNADAILQQIGAQLLVLPGSRTRELAFIGSQIERAQVGQVKVYG